MVGIPRTISENETKSLPENWQIVMKLLVKNISLVMFNKNSDKAFLSDIFFIEIAMKYVMMVISNEIADGIIIKKNSISNMTHHHFPTELPI